LCSRAFWISSMWSMAAAWLSQKSFVAAAACCAESGAFFFQSSQSLSFRDIAQSLAALPADRFSK